MTIPPVHELEPHRWDCECYEVAQGLQQKWPDLKYDSGFYVHPERGAGDHGWNIAPDGTIVDMTATQHDYAGPEDEPEIEPESFSAPKHPEIVPPGHPYYDRYVSYNRHWPQAASIAHDRGEHERSDFLHNCPKCNPDDWERHAKTAADDWSDDWEPSESDVLTASEIQPWQRGALGKGLLGDDGSILASWIVSDFGDPHHDDVASQLGLNYVAKFDIFPSGACYIPSPDDESLFGVDREWAENALEAAGPQVGLNLYRGFTAKRLTRLGIDMQADALANRTHGIVVDVESGEGPPRARHATEGDLAAAWDEMDDHPSSVARLAGLTLPQQQRAWAGLEANAHSQPVHEFDDGWTLYEHQNPAPVGEFLRNCWQGMTGSSGMSYLALHDHHDLPRVAFYGEADPNGGVKYDSFLGRSNREMNTDESKRIQQWLRATHQQYSVDAGEMENWGSGDKQQDPAEQCTGMYENGNFVHNGDTCPVHEDEDSPHYQASRVVTGSIEDELATWLDSFSAPSSTVDTTPISLHHKDVGDLQHRPPTSVAETPHVDPPSEPYEPYDWAQEDA